MAEEFQFRDVYNPELVKKLGDNIQAVWPEFDSNGFAEAINPRLAALNYGARASLIADQLRQFLPQDYETAAAILIDALGPEPDAEELAGTEGFIIAPQCLFVSRYGLDEVDVSLNALYEMTKRFTAEGDIRPFIQEYPQKTMTFLHKLTQDPSPFARRLASEGTRPRLPLSSRLPAFQKDPTPVLELLEKLKEDPNLMVRRSVANNLNDISKDNGDEVVKTLERWQALDTPEMDWMIGHALRTLIKQGHPGALRLMGYDPHVRVQVTDLMLQASEIKVGEVLVFSFKVQSLEERPSPLMVDYVIHYMKANGKQRPKVFKAIKKTIGPGETLHIQKKRSFAPISTRVFYPGKHLLEIQINGKRHTWEDFILQNG